MVESKSGSSRDRRSKPRKHATAPRPPASTPGIDAEEPSAPDTPSNRAGPSHVHMLWPLLTGLAVGFAVGREVGAWNGTPTVTADSVAATARAAPAAEPAAAAPKAEPAGPDGCKPGTAPTGPVFVKLAAYNPRKGPKDAKVTIVTFSDFQ